MANIYGDMDILEIYNDAQRTFKIHYSELSINELELELAEIERVIKLISSIKDLDSDYYFSMVFKRDIFLYTFVLAEINNRKQLVE